MRRSPAPRPSRRPLGDATRHEGDQTARSRRRVAFVTLASLFFAPFFARPVEAQGTDSLSRAEAWLTETSERHGGDVASVEVRARVAGHHSDLEGLTQRLRRALPEESAGGRTHLELDLHLEDGRLVLGLEAHARTRGWLARLLGVGDSREAHRLDLPLDAPLRRYVAALPALTESSVVQRAFGLPSRDYLALTVADLGDQGPHELVLLRADGVLEVLRLGADASGRTRLRALGEVPLPAIERPGLGAPRPFGILTPDAGGVLVASRDRNAILRLTLADGRPRLELVDDAICPPLAMPLPDACALPVDARDYFASELLPRTGHPAPPRAPTSFYARVRRVLHRADGSVGDVEAVVTPRGRLAVRTDARVVGVMGHGAALAADDVDGDGQVELLTSSDAALGAGDSLHVFRVRADGGLRTVWRSEPLEGAVLVGGTGDLDLDGTPELLAIEEPREPGGRATLWVVR